MKFYGTLELLKNGDTKELDIEFDEYGSEISGKVLTLYEAKSQPDILVKIIDSTYLKNNWGGVFYIPYSEEP